MKIIKSILFVASCVVICYVAWLLFYWLTPFIMGLSWFWMIMIFLVMGGFTIPLIGFIPGLLSSAISGLRTSNILEIIVSVIVIGFFAFSACRLAWTVNLSTGAKEVVFALMQNSLVVGVFWGLLNSFVLYEE